MCARAGVRVCVSLTVFRRSCSATLILELRAGEQRATAGPSSPGCPPVRCLRWVGVSAAAAGTEPGSGPGAEPGPGSGSGRVSALSSPLPLRDSSDPAQHPTSRFLSQTNTPRDTRGLTSSHGLRHLLQLPHLSMYLFWFWWIRVRLCSREDCNPAGRINILIAPEGIRGIPSGASEMIQKHKQFCPLPAERWNCADGNLQTES
ncbi:uncharacterized protein LOC116707931 [Xiphophorus hellerii]|uniref:uncharacterized protein LOC116707931 n=1 Tax=Xiphophorus hellerii TaxID=8084 RepID=UPI0013B446F2|nr:uncharacterized protein LOC116707931 [Xiphophorus hellerii]